MFRDEIQSLTAADMFRSNIVVADDEAVNRLLIGKYLSSAGFTNVHMAENGAEALELIEQVNADVLVLDIVMPVMDGFEVLETLRSENSKWQSLPILVETALDAPEERNQVFEAGATDLVTKPLNGKELVSRVKIHLENRMLMGQLQDFHERISADLARAQTMQLGLLPSETDIETITADHGIHIASAFHPCEELGGDIWMLIPLSESRLCAVMADLSGHGITAALNSFRVHTALRELDHNVTEAGLVLDELNRRLSTVLPTGQFAAAFCCILDKDKQSLSYSCAAWPNPVMVLPNSTDPVVLDGSGLPLGVLEDNSYVSKQVDFPSGASVMGFSDALVESVDQNDVMIGEDALLDMVRAATMTDGDLLQSVMSAFRERAGYILDDDLTVVTFTANY